MATEIITQTEGNAVTSPSPIDLPERNLPRVDSPVEEGDLKQSGTVAERPAKEENSIEQGIQAKRPEAKVRRVIDEEGGTTTASVSSYSHLATGTIALTFESIPTTFQSGTMGRNTHHGSLSNILSMEKMPTQASRTFSSKEQSCNTLLLPQDQR
jgi:hypothetical protein